MSSSEGGTSPREVILHVAESNIDAMDQPSSQTATEASTDGDSNVNSDSDDLVEPAELSTTKIGLKADSATADATITRRRRWCAFGFLLLLTSLAVAVGLLVWQLRHSPSVQLHSIRVTDSSAGLMNQQVQAGIGATSQSTSTNSNSNSIASSSLASFVLSANMSVSGGPSYTSLVVTEGRCQLTLRHSLATFGDDLDENASPMVDDSLLVVNLNTEDLSDVTLGTEFAPVAVSLRLGDLQSTSLQSLLVWTSGIEERSQLPKKVSIKYDCTAAADINVFGVSLGNWHFNKIDEFLIDSDASLFSYNGQDSSTGSAAANQDASSSTDDSSNTQTHKLTLPFLVPLGSDGPFADFQSFILDIPYLHYNVLPEVNQEGATPSAKALFDSFHYVWKQQQQSPIGVDVKLLPASLQLVESAAGGAMPALEFLLQPILPFYSSGASACVDPTTLDAEGVVSDPHSVQIDASSLASFNFISCPDSLQSSAAWSYVVGHRNKVAFVRELTLPSLNPFPLSVDPPPAAHNATFSMCSGVYLNSQKLKQVGGCFALWTDFGMKNTFVVQINATSSFALYTEIQSSPGISGTEANVYLFNQLDVSGSSYSHTEGRFLFDGNTGFEMEIYETPAEISPITAFNSRWGFQCRGRSIPATGLTHGSLIADGVLTMQSNVKSVVSLIGDINQNAQHASFNFYESIESLYPPSAPRAAAQLDVSWQQPVNTLTDRILSVEANSTVAATYFGRTLTSSAQFGLTHNSSAVHSLTEYGFVESGVATLPVDPMFARMSAGYTVEMIKPPTGPSTGYFDGKGRNVHISGIALIYSQPASELDVYWLIAPDNSHVDLGLHETGGFFTSATTGSQGQTLFDPTTTRFSVLLDASFNSSTSTLPFSAEFDTQLWRFGNIQTNSELHLTINNTIGFYPSIRFYETVSPIQPVDLSQARIISVYDFGLRQHQKLEWEIRGSTIYQGTVVTQGDMYFSLDQVNDVMLFEVVESGRTLFFPDRMELATIVRWQSEQNATRNADPIWSALTLLSGPYTTASQIAIFADTPSNAVKVYRLNFLEGVVIDLPTAVNEAAARSKANYSVTITRNTPDSVSYELFGSAYSDSLLVSQVEGLYTNDQPHGLVLLNLHESGSVLRPLGSYDPTIERVSFMSNINWNSSSSTAYLDMGMQAYVTGNCLFHPELNVQINDGYAHLQLAEYANSLSPFVATKPRVNMDYYASWFHPSDGLGNDITMMTINGTITGTTTNRFFSTGQQMIFNVNNTHSGLTSLQYGLIENDASIPFPFDPSTSRLSANYNLDAVHPPPPAGTTTNNNPLDVHVYGKAFRRGSLTSVSDLRYQLDSSHGHAAVVVHESGVSLQPVGAFDPNSERFSLFSDYFWNESPIFDLFTNATVWAQGSLVSHPEMNVQVNTTAQTVKLAVREAPTFAPPSDPLTARLFGTFFLHYYVSAKKFVQQQLPACYPVDLIPGRGPGVVDGSCAASSILGIPYATSCSESCAPGYVVTTPGRQLCSFWGWQGTHPVCSTPRDCILPTLADGLNAGSCNSTMSGFSSNCTLGVEHGYGVCSGSTDLICNDGSFNDWPLVGRNCSTDVVVVSSTGPAPSSTGLSPEQEAIASVQVTFKLLPTANTTSQSTDFIVSLATAILATLQVPATRITGLTVASDGTVSFTILPDTSASAGGSTTTPVTAASLGTKFASAVTDPNSAISKSSIGQYVDTSYAPLLVETLPSSTGSFVYIEPIESGGSSTKLSQTGIIIIAVVCSLVGVAAIAFGVMMLRKRAPVKSLTDYAAQPSPPPAAAAAPTVAAAVAPPAPATTVISPQLPAGGE